MKSPADVQLLSVGRSLQHFDRFLVRSYFLFRNVFEPQVLVRSFIREQHAIVECILAAKVVSENDVGQFVRQDHGQTAFIGKHIDQPAAHDDCVADAKGFEWRGRQHSGPNRPWQFDVVRDLEVVDYGL